jgi:hypothetical protein
MPRPLIVMALRLADVLERENEALRAMDLHRAASLLPEKTAALADLSAAVETAEEPANPVLASAARRSAAERLDGLAAENRRLLERAIAAQQRVIAIVVSAVAGVATGSSYGSNGCRNRPAGPMALSTRA